MKMWIWGFQKLFFPFYGKALPKTAQMNAEQTHGNRERGREEERAGGAEVRAWGKRGTEGDRERFRGPKKLLELLTQAVCEQYSWTFLVCNSLNSSGGLEAVEVAAFYPETRTSRLVQMLLTTRITMKEDCAINSVINTLENYVRLGKKLELGLQQHSGDGAIGSWSNTGWMIRSLLWWPAQGGSVFS